jgi:hypothetical protein
MRNANKKIAAVAGAGAPVLRVGTAYAYWTTSGGGDGSAATSATQVLLTAADPDAGNTAITALGGQTVVKAKVSNSATYQQQGGVITGTPTFPSGCGADNWTWTSASTAVGLVGASSSKTVDVGTLTLKSLDGVNQDGCKGATVSFSYAIAAPTP